MTKLVITAAVLAILFADLLAAAQDKTPIHLLLQTSTGSELVHGACQEAFESFHDVEIAKTWRSNDGIPSVVLRFTEVPTNADTYVVIEADILQHLLSPAVVKEDESPGQYTRELYWHSYEGRLSSVEILCDQLASDIHDQLVKSDRTDGPQPSDSAP
jgi:hypothetical protein